MKHLSASILIYSIFLASCGGGGAGESAPAGTGNTTPTAPPVTAAPVTPAPVIPAPVTPAPVNTAPVADAGPKLSINVGSQVSLDGSASKDSDGNALTYSWTFISKPSASRAIISNATQAKAFFVPDVLGEYLISLVVNDGKSDSAPAATSVLFSIPFATTPAVTATPFPPTATGGWTTESYWKFEYAGSETGYCDALIAYHDSSYAYPSLASSVRTTGTCVSKGNVLGNFSASGVVNSSGTMTLNMSPNAAAPVGAIFRGALHLDGTGNGEWSVPNTEFKGSWTATRYVGKRYYPVPTLANPDPGSFAAVSTGIVGIWKRPSITNYPEMGYIAPNGDFAWQVGSPTAGIGRVFGKISSDTSAWSFAANSTIFDGSGIQSAMASGTFTPRMQITGVMQAPTGRPVTISFDEYSIENALAVSLQETSGTYVADGVFYIAPDGTVTGTTGSDQPGCSYSGKLSETVPGTKFNLFQVSLSYSGTCGSALMGPQFTGYATFMLSSNGERYMYSLVRPTTVKAGSTDTRALFSQFFGGHQIR